MLDTLEDVLAKIRKLLALAKGNGNENEAAIAAAAAAKLMAEYEIQEAQVEVDTGEVRLDPIEDLAFDKIRENESWRGLVLVGVGHLTGCRVWTESGVIKAFGRRSKVNTLTYMYAYLCEEVERLTQDEWLLASRARINPTKVPALRWKPSFRLGCAGRLQNRLIELARENRKQLQASPGALVVLHRRDKEVDSAFKDLGLNLRSRSSSQVYDNGAWNAGVKAANTVQLGGGGKALGATAPRPAPPPSPQRSALALELRRTVRAVFRRKWV